MRYLSLLVFLVCTVSFASYIETHDELQFFQQGSTPSNPAAGKNKLYFKTDGKLYKLSSAGVETEIGAGSGGGVTKYANLAAFPATCDDADLGIAVDTNIMYVCESNVWGKIAQDISTDGTFTANSDALVPTQKAVKTYADTKQAALTPGSISTTTTGVTVGSGSNSTVGPSVTVDVQTASGSQPGLLSAADWTTFNGKQASLGFTAVPDTRKVNGYALTADVVQPKENLIVNPSAEDSSAASDTWTCTNATAAISTGNAASPTHNFVLTATAAGGYCEASFTTLAGRVNQDSFFYYKTTATDVVFGAYLGANPQNSATLASKSAMSESSHVTFITDGTATAGTIRVTMPTNGTVIYIDDAYVGKNLNIGSVAQAYEVGSLTWPTTVNCEWSGNNAGWASFAVDNDCSDPIVTGKLTAPSSKTPSFGLSGGAGVYEITVMGLMYSEVSASTVTSGDFRFLGADGQATSIVTLRSGGASGVINTSPGSYTFRIKYDNAVNTTMSLQQRSYAGSQYVYAGTGLNVPLTMSVKYFPTSSQTAIMVGAESQTVALTGDAASAGASACIKFPTSAGPGASNYSATTGLYTVKKAGYYTVTGYVNGNSSIAYSLHNSTKSTDVRIAYASSGISTLSGTFYADYGDQVCLSPSGATDLDVVSYFNIVDGTQSTPHPVVVNSVTTEYPGQAWEYWGELDDSGIVNSGSGGWTTSNYSTGRNIVAFTTPAPSTDAYTCGCSSINDAVSHCNSQDGATTKTASQIAFGNVRSSTEAYRSATIHFHCYIKR